MLRRGRGDEIGVVEQVEHASGGRSPALAETPSRRLTQTTSALGRAHEGVLDLMSPVGLVRPRLGRCFAAGLDTGRGLLMSTTRLNGERIGMDEAIRSRAAPAWILGRVG